MTQKNAIRTQENILTVAQNSLPTGDKMMNKNSRLDRKDEPMKKISLPSPQKLAMIERIHGVTAAEIVAAAQAFNDTRMKLVGCSNRSDIPGRPAPKVVVWKHEGKIWEAKLSQMDRDQHHHKIMTAYPMEDNWDNDGRTVAQQVEARRKTFNLEQSRTV